MRRIPVSGGVSESVTQRRYLTCEIRPGGAHGTRPAGREGVGVELAARQTAGVELLVTGGTGRLGQRLLQPLQDAGHRVRLMSRRGAGPAGVRGNLASGRDLSTALRGAEIVVHAAQDPRGDPWQVDVAGTRRLVEAADRDRLRHLVYVSIVGVDRIPWSYYRAKFAAEQILLASGLPVTLLRATQFYDFVDELLGGARRGPVIPVPMGWRTQPVDVGELAAHIAELCDLPPAGDVVEYGGPEELSAADLARAWAAVRAPGAHVVATPVPGRLSTAFRDGAPTPSTSAADPHRVLPARNRRTTDNRGRAVRKPPETVGGRT